MIDVIDKLSILEIVSIFVARVWEKEKRGWGGVAGRGVDPMKLFDLLLSIPIIIIIIIILSHHRSHLNWWSNVTP